MSNPVTPPCGPIGNPQSSKHAPCAPKILVAWILVQTRVCDGMPKVPPTFDLASRAAGFLVQSHGSTINRGLRYYHDGTKENCRLAAGGWAGVCAAGVGIPGGGGGAVNAGCRSGPGGKNFGRDPGEERGRQGSRHRRAARAEILH